MAFHGHAAQRSASSLGPTTREQSRFPLGPITARASYSHADLRGTWQFHTVSAGGGAWWWWRATIVIGADGSFLATATESGGGAYTETGQFTISTNGIVSFPGHPAFRGVVDAGKTVLVSTNTWPDGASEMSVGFKMRQ